MKRISIILSILAFIMIVIPSLLVLPNSLKQKQVTLGQKEENLSTDESTAQAHIPVYRTASNQLETVPLEHYVAGVLASEMPADFEMEALKAQALAARTYIVKQMIDRPEMDLPDGAAVTDTILHQVYRDPDELQELWGQEYTWKQERISEAVAATEGQILTYKQEPITASFFSTSNGYTENAEDYWQNEVPYLKSVSSPWDESSPKFSDHQQFAVTTFEEKLGVKLEEDEPFDQAIKRTASQRIAEIEIGGKRFTGRDVREKLDLSSTDFAIKKKGDRVIIQTKGYGHGVGMSQYGANGMAYEGKSAEEIVSHYYQGIEVTSASSFTEKFTVQK